MKRSLFRAFVVVAATALSLAIAAPAFAHMHRQVGAFETGVGWVEEPAFAGFRNAVQFNIERPAKGHDDHAHGEGEEEAGTPVEDAKLQVEVLFGGPDATEKTEAMELTPAFGSPGEYRAFLIPTRAGTYTFHVFGTIGKVEFDQMYTSGEDGPIEGDIGQYHDVREPADVMFPAKDPSAADLDEKVSTETSKVAAVASSADDSAGTATMLAIVGIVLGALALAMSILRKPKKTAV